jgi:two-component system chemotaxis response regulator CheB
MAKKINVLVVDDSAVVRKILTDNLSAHPGIHVVGSAIDPYVARDKIVKLDVDVITLDIEMPRMDGLTFLKHLMRSYPMPVIIVSSLTDMKNKASIEALELGALDIVPKPGGPYSVSDVVDQLARKIIGASRVDQSKLRLISEKLNTKKPKKRTSQLARIKTTNRLLAIGASTGGTTALEHLFKGFDKSFPPTACVIHMPERFTKQFADRLNEICPVTVKEAVHGEKMYTGHVYVAPGDNHMLVKQVGADYIIKINKAPKVFSQRPAVDTLFRSVAENVGRNSTGILLTGMGKDGAEALLEIRKSGGYTIAQDEATSIVFGMPKEAIEIGAAVTVLGLHDIAAHLVEHLAT